MLRRWVCAVVLLALASFVFTPTAQALACSGEAAAYDLSTAEAASPTSEDDHFRGACDQHGACVNGYCHVNTPVGWSTGAETPVTLSMTEAETGRDLDLALASNAPPGLERPPRA